MCGICGIVGNSPYARIDEALIEKMMHPIDHRGPDDRGTHVERDIAAFGHLRLSIIDVAAGAQPIYNEDQTKSIVFNGEIYNYLELREDLLSRGHRFATRSDTEVILHLYEDKGKDCVRDLRGMFAFAIWDSAERTLFLARDRLGIKPLYYAQRGQSFCFASEIKSLLASGLVERSLHHPSIDQYLALNYTLGPRTMLEGVMKLMPAQSLLYRDGQVMLSEYWDFNAVEETTDSFETCFEKMGTLIEDCVRSHLMSEVPLGAFLSGGVDSSVTVALMTRLTGRPVKTFTVGYEDAEDESELHYARIVASHFNSEHHEFILKPGKFMDIVSRVIWHLDEPVAEFATIPLLLLSELAKKHVTVMLSGEGADEIFAGYPIYRIMNAVEKYRRIPGPLRRGLFDPLASLWLSGKREGKYLDWLTLPLERRYIGNGSYFTDRMRNRLYSKDFQRVLDRGELYRLLDDCYGRVSGRDPIRRMLYLDTRTWLPEDLLIKADKMTMAAALELRVPFLDHKLVEFATSLPSHMKATATQSKFIFKKYAEGLIPHEIVHRKKRGFPVPVKQWLRNELSTAAQDILLDPGTERRGFLDANYVRTLLDTHLSGREDFSKNIWNLLILELWMRTFIDGGPNWVQN